MKGINLIATLMRKNNHCARCCRNSDCIRAHFTAGVVLFHWRCFLVQMRENNAAKENSAIAGEHR